MSNVTIIGAGLAGSLLAIYMARRDFSVDVYEARSDMRKSEVPAGRSINLALSDRGIKALSEVGMDAYILAEAVPMTGRMIHTPSGDTKLLQYSGRPGEFINSISRAGLNIALINEAEKYDNVTFHFNSACSNIDSSSGEVIFANGERMLGDAVIATDGAGSAVRQSMQRILPQMTVNSVFLEHGYKELHIPPGENGGSLLEKNALHIWPRHQFMMIALPNFDGSFTCTLFLDRARLEAIQSSDDVLSFFKTEFADAVELMPTLTDDFFANPIGDLGTMKCRPWHLDGKFLLLGDAAHAMVPFYGQGMNCAFEDVRVLSELIDMGGESVDWVTLFAEYSEIRKPNTDAIQDLAVENFYEMRDKVADPVFQRKREIETKLEQTYPDYFSKYSMVTFRADLPYSDAKRVGNIQDEILMNICSQKSNTDILDLDEVMNLMRNIHN